MNRDAYSGARFRELFGSWSELGRERTVTNFGPMVVPLPEVEVIARNYQLTCTP
jgi:hypothetical protein